MRLGFLEEAASFMDWVQRRCEAATKERDVMIMYAVDGSEHIPETILAISTATRGHGRCGSATARSGSGRSTCTAN